MVDLSGPLGTVSPWTWALLGIGLYWLVVLWLRRAALLPEYVSTQGPILMLHTRRFRELLDRIAAPKRAWRAWGNVGIGVALVVMVGSFLLIVYGAYNQLANPQPPTPVNQPQNVLVIPGVNEFLPLSVAPEIVLGLLVGLVVHEGGHGLMCRVGDIEIESVGLALLAILPIGAFVEPDEDSRRAASRGDQTRMFAAGVMNNFAIAFLVLALLFGPVVGMLGVANGAAVGAALPGSAAEEAGIGAGDRIVAVDGRPVANNSDLGSTLAGVEGRSVPVRVDEGETTRTVTVNRSVLVVQVVGESSFGVGVGDRIVSVNGTPVHTEAEFREALESRRVATLETAGGTTATGPVGASVLVTEDGPMASAGVEPGPAVITAIDGQRVTSAQALSDVLDDTRPGQSVAVEFYRDGARTERSVELGEHQDGHGLLGIRVSPGISGLSVNDFGVRLYPAGEYLGLLGGGDGGGFLQRAILVYVLPFASLFGLPYNFPGFTGGTANFYVVPDPLAGVAGLVFGLANALFWIGWINLVLGQFNCIPAFPLDGGHLLRTSTEAVVSRLPVSNRRQLTTMVTTSIGLIMLLSLVFMLFGPQLLR